MKKAQFKISALFFVFFIIAPLSLATCKRNAIWQDDFTMWTDALNASRGKARTYYNLGAAYHDEKGSPDEAIIYYKKALSIEPNYAGVHNDLGDALRDKGLLNEAILEYRTALSLKPVYPKAHNNLGIAYAMRGNPDEAIQEFETALRLMPDNPDIRNNLEKAYRDKALQ